MSSDCLGCATVVEKGVGIRGAAGGTTVRSVAWRCTLAPDGLRVREDRKCSGGGGMLLVERTGPITPNEYEPDYRV